MPPEPRPGSRALPGTPAPQPGAPKPDGSVTRDEPLARITRLRCTAVPIHGTVPASAIIADTASDIHHSNSTEPFRFGNCEWPRLARIGPDRLRERDYLIRRPCFFWW